MWALCNSPRRRDLPSNSTDCTQLPQQAESNNEKKFENRLRFDKVIDINSLSRFIEHSVLFSSEQISFNFISVSVLY